MNLKSQSLETISQLKEDEVLSLACVEPGFGLSPNDSESQSLPSPTLIPGPSWYLAMSKALGQPVAFQGASLSRGAKQSSINKSYRVGACRVLLELHWGLREKNAILCLPGPWPGY